jgi:hypothetical protein
LVNKNNELYAKRPKKITALMLCIHPLTTVGRRNVPTSAALDAAHGKMHIHNPNIPAKVQIISSYLSYPL